MNTPESDIENAAKHNPAWMTLFALEHAGTPGLDMNVLTEAYNEAWNAGHQAGYRQGVKEDNQ